MTRTHLNLFLFCLLLLTVGLNIFIRRDVSKPNLEFMPDMAHAVPYESFSENENFEDKQNNRAQVEGTVPRGVTPLHFKATPEDAIRAGVELANPFDTKDEKALERGGIVYGRNCVSCHGAEGKGDGQVIKRGYPAPPSYLTGNSLKMKDGQLFHIITYGQKNMSGQAALLSVEDRWRLVLKIRNMQKKHKEGIAEATKKAEEKKKANKKSKGTEK